MESDGEDSEYGSEDHTSYQAWVRDSDAWETFLPGWIAPCTYLPEKELNRRLILTHLRDHMIRSHEHQEIVRRAEHAFGYKMADMSVDTLAFLGDVLLGREVFETLRVLLVDDSEKPPKDERSWLTIIGVPLDWERSIPSELESHCARMIQFLNGDSFDDVVVIIEALESECSFMDMPLPHLITAVETLVPHSPQTRLRLGLNARPPTPQFSPQPSRQSSRQSSPQLSFEYSPESSPVADTFIADS